MSFLLPFNYLFTKLLLASPLTFRQVLLHLQIAV
jgi:hypothetical protein